MHDIGSLVRTLRLKEGYPLRKVAAYLDIKLSKEQVIKLAKLFNYNEKEMLVTCLSDRILSEIGDDEFAKEALKVAEEKKSEQGLDLRLLFKERGRTRKRH
jgi:hypothetical protein